MAKHVSADLSGDDTFDQIVKLKVCVGILPVVSCFLTVASFKDW